jgi:hypothetical protein
LEVVPLVRHAALDGARERRVDQRLRLTRCDARGWRATFYIARIEHSPTSAIGTGWERTPWQPTQRGAWAAFVGDPR